METRMSRIIGMVVRVVQFCLEHISPVEGHTEVVGRLEALLTRMQILAAQESQGRRQARAKVSGKEKYKRVLHRQLKFLSLVARGRAAENPELPRIFALPRLTLKQEEYLPAAEAMVAEAEKYQALFSEDGLSPRILEELRQALAAYREAAAGKLQGVSRHIGARSQLKASAREALELVRRLDGINQYRFRDDPELLAAWLAARDVSWPGNNPEAPKQEGTA